MHRKAYTILRVIHPCNDERITSEIWKIHHPRKQNEGSHKGPNPRGFLSRPESNCKRIETYALKHWSTSKEDQQSTWCRKRYIWTNRKALLHMEHKHCVDHKEKREKKDEQKSIDAPGTTRNEDPRNKQPRRRSWRGMFIRVWHSGGRTACSTHLQLIVVHAKQFHCLKRN